MAVVTHGSFDEGPIVLALPPTFEFTGEEEDPIFTAWDRSTGITISASQVTDFDTEVANNTAVALNTAKISYPAADAAKLAGIAAGATNVNSALLVPYTGATGDVDLGTYDLSVGKITIDDAPSSPTDAATKGYVDSVVTSGIVWGKAVLDIVSSLPESPTSGDRYILSSDNHINEYNGATWDSVHPDTGTTLYVEGDVNAPTNNVGIHTFNGTSWVYVGSSIKHNDTTDKEGGSGGHYYHLGETTHDTVTIITTTGADAVPTGLTVVETGIDTSSDGTQSAYIELTWDVISTNTFRQYILQYRRSNYTYYTTVICKTNHVIISELIPGISYDFRIASENIYGTYSDFSSPNVTQLMPNDSGVPGDVTGVSATGGIQYVIIEWTANTESDLANYKIYRNTTNDSGTATLIGTCRTTYFVDGGRTGGQVYYYWVKAVDTSGNSSAGFSSEAHATPRNVGTTDVEVIAANKILIDGSVYLSNWRHTSDITKIDGGNIYTGSITTSQLKFTPIVSVDGTGDIIATINASEEGISISGDHININGSTDFSAIGTNGRLFIHEDNNTALRITDDNGDDVFKVEIDGTNVGDVTIGDWGASQGIKYDRSNRLTSFAGTILASAGTIGGFTINPTYLSSSGAGISPADYPFYAGSTYGDRAIAPFKVLPTGEVDVNYLRVTNLTDYYLPRVTASSRLTDSALSDNGDYVTMSGGFVVPVRNRSQMFSLPGLTAGMLCFMTTGSPSGYTNQLCVYNGSTWKMLTQPNVPNL